MPIGARRYAYLFVEEALAAGLSSVTSATTNPSPFTAERYLALAEEGVLGPEDRVELLEGLIVAEPPHTPAHASATRRVYGVLRNAIGTRAVGCRRCRLPSTA